MPAISYSGILILALVAVAIPATLALMPRLPAPGPSRKSWPGS